MAPAGAGRPPAAYRAVMEGSLDTALESLLAWKGAIVAVWLLLFVAGERLAAAAPAPAETGLPAAWAGHLGPWRRVLRNLAVWSLNLPLSLLVVLPATAWASATRAGLAAGGVERLVRSAARPAAARFSDSTGTG